MVSGRKQSPPDTRPYWLISHCDEKKENTMDLTNVIAFRSNKTIYRDGDTVVKVFGEGFKKADVLNEALNHARVEETALNVPTLYGVGMTPEGKWYIMTEFIPGQTLAELMAQNPKKHAQYLAQLWICNCSCTAKSARFCPGFGTRWIARSFRPICRPRRNMTFTHA